MKPNRIVLFAGAAAVLAAWLAATADQERMRPASSGARDLAEVERAESVARDIQSQAALLRARLATAPAPSTRGRNPFVFPPPPAAPPRESSSASAPSFDHVPPAPTVPEPPPFSLSGIAEDDTAEGGRIRIAVLSGMGDVFLAKAGDLVQDRYSVIAVGADAVELKDLSTGRTIRLGLR